jgi:hypothetical protein
MPRAVALSDLWSTWIGEMLQLTCGACHGRAHDRAPGRRTQAGFPVLIRPDSSNAVWIDRMPNTRMLWALAKLSCTRPGEGGQKSLSV